MIDPATPLACPLDGLALALSGRAWQCPAGHSYDLARSGYLNLLPVQYKRSKDPGDSREMVAARQRVMASGLFEPLAVQLADQACTALAGVTARPALLVDAGCGEGYFSEALHHALRTRLPALALQLVGVDISRAAIATAAGRRREPGWIVANNRRLPILRGHCELICSMFGFETWTPWAELQTPGQQVLVAHAGPRHLIELREVIYDTVYVHDPVDDAAPLDAGYERLDQSVLHTRRDVPSAGLWSDLLLMTPHGHRARTRDLDLPGRLNGRAVTLDVQLRRYRRV